MNIQQEGAVRSRRTRQEVRQLVSAFPASGLGAREFCQRHGNGFKVLFWDGRGFGVGKKGLKKGRYSWQRQLRACSACVTLSKEDFALLMGGIDLSKTRRKNWYRKVA